MRSATAETDQVARYLDQLRAVPFVRDARFASPAKDSASRHDGTLTLRTEGGRFEFLVEVRRSYLDRACTHAIIAMARLLRRQQARSLFLCARYIPRPTGEELIAADVNFADLAGNMHLALGRRFRRTILGRPETGKPVAKRAFTAAKVQLLFLFAAQPESVGWPVRDIASVAGVSKSKAAQVRQELIEEGYVEAVDRTYRFRFTRELEPLLLTGYAGVLRPKLLIGRFRGPESKPEEFLERLPAAIAGTGARFALTGGPAADLLQHFYRGPELPFFLTDSRPDVLGRLRLLPDRAGPVILLRAFGEFVFWRTIASVTIAPVWLVYAELMISTDPRAHEAAEELRREFLAS